MDKNKKSPCVNKLKNFLIKHIVTGKGTEYTQTDCGPPYKKYFISDEDQKIFYKLYNKALGEVDFHITEKPKKISPFTIDIDFRFSEENSVRQYSKKDVSYIIKNYNKILSKYIKLNKKKKTVFLF